MANTVTLQDTLNFVNALIVQRPQVGVGGVTNQPFLTAANKIMCTILANPFIWEWNRVFAASAISATQGASDYSVSLPNFGFLEKATINYVTPVTGMNPNYELEVWRDISKDTKPNRPGHIAVLLDDNEGNITFRLFPAPDQEYTVDLIYQGAPIEATTINNSSGFTTWAPIPDKFQYLYEQGMLAHMQMMYNQQLALSNLEIFYRSLIATAEGLSEMEKALWLEDQLRLVKAQINVTQGTAQGKQARQ
jgi:hypothetical protein